MDLCTTLLLAALAAGPAPEAGGDAGVPAPAFEPDAGAKPPDVPAVAEPSQLSPPKPAPKVETEAGPRELLVGLSGVFRPFLSVQTWFFYDRFPPSGCSASDCVTSFSTFRFRRAEMGLTGELLDGKLAYKATIEPARLLEFVDKTLKVSGTPNATVVAKQPQQSSSILNDLLATYLFTAVDITAGQFRVPVSWEGYNSSARLLFPERALVTRIYGDRRDIGLRLAKTFKHFGYGVFLFNGAGQNNLDVNNGKDAAVRLETYPIEGMILALAYYGSVGLRADKGARDFLEADFRYQSQKVGPVSFLVQSEFIRGWNRPETNAPFNPSYGFYVAAAATALDTVQAAVRFTHFDPSLGREGAGAFAPGVGFNSEVNVYEAGLNWFIRKDEVKIQASYGFFDWKTVPAEHQVIVSNQLSF
ncbi:MAG TPA: porin [Myxococcales bacterium]|jgi:hypothetical protein